MNFKDKSSANRLLLGVGVLGLLLIVLFYFYSPYAIEARKLKKAARQFSKQTELLSQDKLPFLEEERKSLEDLQKNYKELLKKIKLANQRIPPQGNLGELLGELNQIAKDKKVNFIQVRFEDSSDLGKYVQIPIDINLKCNLGRLVLYLDGIEKLPRLVKVNFIKITADKDNELNLDIFLGAESYVLKEG